MLKPEAIEIPCTGYSVVADIYEGSSDGPVLLALMGRSMERRKDHHAALLSYIAQRLGVIAVTFDYTGHGDSPFDSKDLHAAQHLLESITVFDWVKSRYPERKTIVDGFSYGGFLAAQMTQYRPFDGLVLRAPAIYKPADFYTRRENEDVEATHLYRQDSEALAEHPLLANNSRFGGEVLIVAHGDDERIPAPTTDAYSKAFQTNVITMEHFSHDLATADHHELELYHRYIGDWLKNNINSII
jgi:pimeloyl-ACP methyl ester carboxylesterase